MIIRKKRLKKLIGNFLNESLIDNVRYPCNPQFILEAAVLIYDLKRGKENYLLESSKVYYEFFKSKVHPQTKVTFEDFFVVLVDHYLNFKSEKDLFGNSTGVMQIKPQGVLDALRTQGVDFYKKELHNKKSIAVRNQATRLFKGNDSAKNVINKTGIFIDGDVDEEKNPPEKIKSSEILSIIGEDLKEASKGTIGKQFNIFVGMGLLMIPNNAPIKNYIAGSDDLSSMRKDRHNIIRKLIQIDTYYLFEIPDYVMKGNFGKRAVPINYGEFSIRYEKFVNHLHKNKPI